MDRGRCGGVLLSGYGLYVLFMWSIHSTGQSWDVVSGTGGHVCAGSLMCAWALGEISQQHVPCLDPLHFIPCQCQCLLLWYSGIGDLIHAMLMGGGVGYHAPRLDRHVSRGDVGVDTPCRR